MAKKLKLKLPKRIAGVKIPKAVRKGPVAHFLNSSAGQVVLAEALVIAGRSFAVNDTEPDSTAGGVVRHPASTVKDVAMRPSGIDPSRLLERNSARLAFAFNEAVRAFRAALEQPVPHEAEPTKNTQAASQADPKMPH